MSSQQESWPSLHPEARCLLPYLFSTMTWFVGRSSQVVLQNVSQEAKGFLYKGDIRALFNEMVRPKPCSWWPRLVEAPINWSTQGMTQAATKLAPLGFQDLEKEHQSLHRTNTQEWFGSILPLFSTVSALLSSAPPSHTCVIATLLSRTFLYLIIWLFE